MWSQGVNKKEKRVKSKEKNKYILIHICETQKSNANEPICKAETETQTEVGHKHINTKEAKGKWYMDWKLGIDI